MQRHTHTRIHTRWLAQVLCRKMHRNTQHTCTDTQKTPAKDLNSVCHAIGPRFVAHEPTPEQNTQTMFVDHEKSQEVKSTTKEVQKEVAEKKEVQKEVGNKKKKWGKQVGGKKEVGKTSGEQKEVGEIPFLYLKSRFCTLLEYRNGI